jgi:hypothetical protein
MYLIRKGEKPQPVCWEHGRVIREKRCPECQREAEYQHQMERLAKQLIEESRQRA